MLHSLRMKYAAIPLCLLVLLGAGCFAKKALPTVLPEAPGQTSEPMAGDVSVTTKTVTREFILNDSASCKLSISYPDIPTAGAIPQEARVAFDNEAFLFLQQSLNTTTPITHYEQIENALADEYIETCKQEITAEYNALAGQGEEFFTNLQRVVNVVYKMTINEFHLVTIGFEEYANTGGAHPNQRTVYYNIDRGGNRLLTLGDVVSSEHLRDFLKVEKTKLLEAHENDIYPESAEEFQAIVNDKSRMSPEDQLEEYGSFNGFYLTPTSIVTYYNTYDIAPYAAGPITIEIPYADVKEYISMNGPLVPLIEKL